MKTLIGLALSSAVLFAAVFSLYPLSSDKMEDTRLAIEQMHVNSLLRSNAGLLAAGELGKILISYDQGKTWNDTEIKKDRQALITAMAFDESGLAGIAVGHEGWILSTKDGGMTWSEIDFKEDGADPWMDVAHIDEGEWMIVGSFGRSLILNEKMEIVRSLEIPDEVADYHLNKIIINHGSHEILVVGERGLLLKGSVSDDKWVVIEPFYDGSFYNGFQLESGRWLVYGMRGNAYISTEGDAGWSRIDIPVKASLFHHNYDRGGSIKLYGQGGLVFTLDAEGDFLKLASIGKRASILDTYVRDDGTILMATDAGLLTQVDTVNAGR